MDPLMHIVSAAPGAAIEALGWAMLGAVAAIFAGAALAGLAITRRH